MKQPIKNLKTEELAQQIARFIFAEDGNAAQELWRSALPKMVRWEMLAFKNRIHFLVKQLEDVS